METFHEAAALKTAHCLSLTATTILTLLCIVIRFSGTKVDVTKFSQTLPSHGNPIKIKTFARPHSGVNFLPDDRPSRHLEAQWAVIQNSVRAQTQRTIWKTSLNPIAFYDTLTKRPNGKVCCILATPLDTHARSASVDAPASHRVPKTVTNQQLRC